MRRQLLLYCLPLLFAAISRSAKAQQHFIRNVGDIRYDSLYDDAAFLICDTLNVLEYYNTASYYLSHRKEIGQLLEQEFIPKTTWRNQHGYLTIRFIINCKGQTGCFRVFQLDTAYQPTVFTKDLSDTLLNRVKKIPGWQPAAYEGKVYDSYQYITFRIKAGKIISIAP